MFKIAIPKPCHEDWDKMTPNQQGRYCKACAKTVNDFTAMSDEDIKDFFINKKEEQVCGRFKKEQLSRIVIDLPANILYIDMPLWKKFLVACLIVFSTSLFSCDTTVDGKHPVVVQQTKENIQSKPLINPGDNVMVGGLAIKWDSISITPVTISIDCPPTYGFTVMMPADTLQIAGDTSVTIIPDSTVTHILSDSASESSKKIPDSNRILKPDSIKTKNPAKPDSVKCDQTIFTSL